LLPEGRNCPQTPGDGIATGRGQVFASRLCTQSPVRIASGKPRRSPAQGLVRGSQANALDQPLRFSAATAGRIWLHHGC
jgi:hypothetical protein